MFIRIISFIALFISYTSVVNASLIDIYINCDVNLDVSFDLDIKSNNRLNVIFSNKVILNSKNNHLKYIKSDDMRFWAPNNSSSDDYILLEFKNLKISTPKEGNLLTSIFGNKQNDFNNEITLSNSITVKIERATLIKHNRMQYIDLLVYLKKNEQFNKYIQIITNAQRSSSNDQTVKSTAHDKISNLITDYADLSGPTTYTVFPLCKDRQKYSLGKSYKLLNYFTTPMWS
jgi:hypothetical protein